MAILSVFQQAATVIGMDVPTAVMSSTEREHVELAALANEMAERIAFDLYDWSVLKKIATLTGDGVATEFAFPTDYRRMLKKAALWPSREPNCALPHCPDIDEWLGLQMSNVSQVRPIWALFGGKINIWPALVDQETVKFTYLSNRIVTAQNGSPKASFTADTDGYVLNERLLKLGIIWQWKANKGLNYAEDLSNFEDAYASLTGADKGSNIIAVGRKRFRSDAGVAFAGAAGTGLPALPNGESYVVDGGSNVTD